MKLSAVLEHLNHLAPLSLAAEWDPVGLQLEPSPDPDIQQILITLDLHDAVAEEAVEKHCNLILAYHPPLFTPPERWVQSNRTARCLMKCHGAGIAVYSPHTALDAVAGGLTDWLAKGLGKGMTSVLEPNETDSRQGHGRLVTLDQAQTAGELARTLSAQLKLPYIRIASQDEMRLIQTIAVCPGAGASLLIGTEADALLTGEMRHHDLLECLANEQIVFLAEHATSERGYLPIYADRIRERVGSEVEVQVSMRDLGPIQNLILNDPSLEGLNLHPAVEHAESAP